MSRAAMVVFVVFASASMSCGSKPPDVADESAASGSRTTASPSPAKQPPKIELPHAEDAITRVVAETGIERPEDREPRLVSATVNIARGKPYTFSRKPNYSLCTDEGDRTDLTDGVRTLDRYWVQKSTVGWQRARGPVAITVDLGKVEPIMGAALGSAGGSAGVTYPHSIVVSVGDDGKDLRVAGDLVRLSEGRLPAPGYGEGDERGGIHTYRTRRMPARGRYVPGVLSMEVIRP